jgi:S-formylglutathione hydrolase
MRELQNAKIDPAPFLERSCARAGVPLTLRMHAGYDHSYFFISTFIEDHLRWHAQRLGIATNPN